MKKLLELWSVVLHKIDKIAELNRKYFCQWSTIAVKQEVKYPSN